MTRLEAVKAFDADLKDVFDLLRVRTSLETAVAMLMYNALSACKQAGVKKEYVMAATRGVYGESAGQK